MLGLVGYKFPFLDLTVHFSIIVLCAVLPTIIFPKRRQLFLAFAAMVGVIVAFAASFATSFVWTGEARTWWTIDEAIHGFRDDAWGWADWLRFLIPHLFIQVLIPWYAAWLLARWCLHTRVAKFDSVGRIET